MCSLLAVILIFKGMHHATRLQAQEASVYVVHNQHKKQTTCHSPFSNSIPAFGLETWRPASDSYRWERRPTSSIQ